MAIISLIVSWTGGKSSSPCVTAFSNSALPPDPQELAEAPHFFIQNKSIHEAYTVGDFETEAIDTIQQLFETKDVVIMVGGSALYEKAVTHGLDDFPPVDETIKLKIATDYKEHGLSWLQNQVLSVDPDFYHSTDHQNPRRLLRALEIFESSGQKISALRSTNIKKRNFDVIKVGLQADRSELYERINSRVELMKLLMLGTLSRKRYPKQSYLWQ